MSKNRTPLERLLLEELKPFAKAYARLLYYGDAPSNHDQALFSTTDYGQTEVELLDDIDGEPLTVHRLAQAYSAYNTYCEADEKVEPTHP